MPTPITDLNSIVRDAEVYTMRRYDAWATMSGVSSGVIIAGMAVARKTGLYSNIRIFISSAGTSLTDLKLGVWTPDGATLIASTTDVKASVATNNWLQASLDEPVALAAGDIIMLGLGVAHSGTSIATRGIGIQSANTFLTQSTSSTWKSYRGLNAGGFTAGATLPGSLVHNAGPGILPLMELA